MLLMWMKILRGPPERRQAFQAPSGSGNRQVSHLPGGAGDARNTRGFLVAPERAVKKHDVAVLQAFQQGIGDAGDTGKKRQRSSSRLGRDQKTDHGIRRIQFRQPGCAYETRKGTRQRQHFQARATRAKRLVQRDIIPADLTGEAREHAKHTVVFGENPANRRRGVYAKRMKLAKQQEAERLVHFRARQNHIANRRVSRPVPAAKVPASLQFESEDPVRR